MYRWANCSGSVRLLKALADAGVKDQDSEYAAEGHKAHAVGEYRLRTGMWPANVTPAMKEAVKIYTDFVEQVGGVLLVEHSFDLSAIHTGCFGTSDAVVWDTFSRRLMVIDYKHGAGVFVDVPGNMQLQYYALGCLLTLPYEPEEVILVVVQPRIPHEQGPIRWWERTPEELRRFGEDLMRYAEATEDPKACLTAGPWCMFCPARRLGECWTCDEETWQRVRKLPAKTDPRTEFKVVK